MRLFEIDNLSSRDEVTDFIKENCKPYLRENPSHIDFPLYRGINLKSEVPMILDIKKDRTPVDTNQQASDAINNAMDQAGFQARRDNSIFCTGFARQAKSYGELYIIYPIGNYAFSWAEQIDDLYKFYGQLFIDGYLNIPTDTVIESPRLGNCQLMTKLFNKFGLESYDKVIAEPMAFGDIINFYAKLLDQDYETTKLDLFTNHGQPAGVARRWAIYTSELETNNLIEYIKSVYSNRNIQRAIASHVEIMVTGDKYLAIPKREHNAFI